MATDTGFSRPDVTTLIERIEADLNSNIPGVDSKLRRSFIGIFATVLAGLVHGLYGYLDFIAKQAIIDTATSAFLERWAAIWSVSRNTATKATGVITVTGTSGMSVNIGTELYRLDEVAYVTTSAATLAAGTADINVEAVEPGLDGNAVIATKLYFTSPISGVDAETAVSTALATGTETEVDDSLRVRLLDRIQNPPHGGSVNDYIQWAKSITGITRVWVYPQELADNGISIRFMMDDTYSNGIPLTTDVDDLQAYLDQDDVKPVTADITVVKPTAVTQNFSITLKKLDGTTESSATVQAAIEAELADMILRDGEPGGKLLKSRLDEAISIAAGEYDHTMTSPAADVSYSTGEIPVMGTVTWS